MNIRAIGAAAIGVTILTLTATGSAQALTLEFDDVPLTEVGNTEGPIPNGYQGFNFINFYAVNTTAYPGTGYAAGTISPNNVAFPAFPQQNGFAEISSNTTFNFNSVYLTAAFNNLEILIEGFLDSNQLFSSIIGVNTQTPLFFEANWSNINRLRFTPQNPSNGNLYFAVDNLSVTPIPTPALLPGLIGLGIAALRNRKQKQSEAKV